MLLLTFILLVVYQVKHFLADYPLQGKFMLGKFKPGWDFVLPLLAHVAVHGAFTLAICLAVAPALWWLALVDVWIHFSMDRIKASPRYLGRYKALSGREYLSIAEKIAVVDAEKKEKLEAELRGNTYFWWALGLDQMVHHLTHYFIIWMLVTN